MSIPHLEDLPPRKLLEVMNNFWEYEATEKLDGSQLLFGIDEDGFYTSRETKGGLRIYNVNDYELSFKNTYIRSAHIALESKLGLLKDAGLIVGCQVEIEVLYGEYPNVIQYSPDKCFIIFLRATEGNVNIDEMRVKLEGQSLTIPLWVPFTDNGKDIDYKEVVNTWEFSRSPVIEIARDIDTDRKFYLNWANNFCKQQYNDHCSVLEFAETLLNRKPSWVDPDKNWSNIRSDLMNDKRAITESVYLHIQKFKEILLHCVVRNQSSAFGPVRGRIEGIVFRHPQTGHMFKLVDKDVFLKVKDFYWKERDKLFKLAKIGYSLEELNHRLTRYEKDKPTFLLAMVCGQFRYNNEIDNRTKEIFATLYQKE